MIGTSIDKPPKNIWHAGCTTVIIFIHSHLATPFNITAPKTNLTILTSKSNSVLNWFAAHARCLRCRDWYSWSRTRTLTHKKMDHWLWVTTCFEHYQEHIMCTGGHHQSLPLSLLYLGDLKPLQAKPAVSTDDDRSTFWEWLSAVYKWCLGEILHVDENDSHAKEATWSIIYGCLKLTVLPSCCKLLFGLQTTKLSTGSMTATTITDSTISYNYNKSHFLLTPAV
jgi:hypothetical protein